MKALQKRQKKLLRKLQTTKNNSRYNSFGFFRIFRGSRIL